MIIREPTPDDFKDESIFFLCQHGKFIYIMQYRDYYTEGYLGIDDEFGTRIKIVDLDDIKVVIPA